MLEWSLDEEKRIRVEVRQNARAIATNRKDLFTMLSPVSSERTWDQALCCYKYRDRMEDALLQDKSVSDGRTFIRMTSMIMVVFDVISRVSENRKIDPKKKKPRDTRSVPQCRS